MSDKQEAASVAWEGDSLEQLQGFPKSVKIGLGADIRRLQRGETPHDYRPMKSIGAGVFELRERDANGWYRIIYLSKVGNTLHMLHTFEKKSNATSPRDVKTATERLKAVRQRIQEEKKNAKYRK